mgnify:FL=1
MKKIASFKSSASTFVKVLKYLKSYLPLFIFSLLFTLIVVILTLYVPILIGQAIDLAVGKDAVDIVEIGKILITISICIAFTAVFQWLINVVNNRMVYGIVRNVRHEAFLRIQNMPVSYIDSHQSGDIVNRIVADSDQFSDGLLLGFSQFFNGIMTIIGTIVFMFIISPPVTLIVVFITPLSLFVASFIAKRTFNLFKKQSEIRSEQTALIDEMIGDHKTVVAFGYENKAQERFDNINAELEKTSLRALFFSSLTNPSTRFVNSLVYAFVAFSGAMICVSFGDEMLKVGMLSSFLSYATQYTKPFNEISGVITELQNALACAQRVFDLIEAPVEEKILLTEDPIIDSSIEFSNVSFAYTEEKPLIKNFSFKAKAGQHIAIVGPTGCGKTTLINLLMRFYDVDEGTVFMGGKDIRTIERGELRRKYGMVLQDTWLSEGTVNENISYGNPNATQEQIIVAAKAAHAHSFIKRLPDGYNTKIGEGGASLSQGQRQLLCIARIMLCEPEILILDEATSSIDTRTERIVQDGMDKLMKGRTTFVIAHRLSTVRNSNAIMVLEKGRIIERGDHDALIDLKGKYYQLYTGAFELE